MGIPQRPEARTRQWRDELAELHVLAANGDTDAAEDARRWLDADPEARQAWADVEQTCRQIAQAGEPTTG